MLEDRQPDLYSEPQASLGNSEALSTKNEIKSKGHSLVMPANSSLFEDLTANFLLSDFIRVLNFGETSCCIGQVG